MRSAVDGRRPRGDVAERSAVDDGRSAFERLEQVGLEGVLEDGRHGPCGVQVLRGDALALVRVADDDPAQALAQVVQRGGEGEQHHDLARGGDVEAGLARQPVLSRPEPDDDVAQGTVVDVEHAPPGDVADVDAELVAVVQVVVDHRREQVVGGRDGVEVAGEVEVEPLHRDDLAVAATGRTALDPERRPHRRLTQRDDRPLAEAVQRLREPDRGRGLALAERRRRHRRDDDVPGRMRRRGLVEDREVDLGDAAAVRLEVLVTDAEVGGDVGDRTQGRCVGDVEVGGQGCAHGPIQLPAPVPRTGIAEPLQ